ncbi:hypothetical protein AB4099_15870, partial [Bosea sp. 2KB_26]|uniref:hypothetical protein n=1 Tax=Bosea sp. 2KB_26 TaxID=3237475 RepID=UPI003F923DE4
GKRLPEWLTQASNTPFRVPASSRNHMPASNRNALPASLRNTPPASIGIRTEGLPAFECPSRRRFYKEIDSLDRFWVHASRHTLDAARKKFASQDKGPEATRIGERIEMDEWKVSLQSLLIKARVWRELDVETRQEVKSGRHWLCIALDRATRCVLAMRLMAEPNADEAIATIRMIFSDKAQLVESANAMTDWSMSTGIGALAVDWGSAFRADKTRAVVISTGATYTHPPASMPEFRGACERIFLTTETRFMPHFAGRTFSNVVQRGDYKSEEKANIPFDVLAQLVVRYVVDDYHNRPHEGLGGETPFNAWHRVLTLTGRIPIPDQHMQRHIFGLEDTCQLDKSGVVMLGLRFQSKRIYYWFTTHGARKVRVRVDPADLGFASVKLGEEWVTVPNVKEEFKGTTLRTWVETATILRARFKDEAALSRPVVLDAMRDIDAVARQYQREAGISEELDTPETLERARNNLGLGFRLPEWEQEDADGVSRDLLDGVIAVPHQVEPPQEDEAPLAIAPPGPAATWRMGDRNEGTS